MDLMSRSSCSSSFPLKKTSKNEFHVYIPKTFIFTFILKNVIMLIKLVNASNTSITTKYKYKCEVYQWNVWAMLKLRW